MATDTGAQHSPEGASVDTISEKLLLAIWEHRLRPGTKLAEEKLAEVFGVSRTKIRLALGKLANDGILTVEPNRGTFVASPTVAQARHVFQARRLIEPALVRGLAGQLRKDQVTRLRRCVALESEARARNDRRATIRLSGEFHLLLAELGQNPYLVRCMRELCSLTCLVIALYDAPGMPACPYHEHETLIDAIERGDGETAAALMLEHLTHVEGTLRLEMPEDKEVDLREVFA